jgi:hypothetical protein
MCDAPSCQGACNQAIYQTEHHVSIVTFKVTNDDRTTLEVASSVPKATRGASALHHQASKLRLILNKQLSRTMRNTSTDLSRRSLEGGAHTTHRHRMGPHTQQMHTWPTCTCGLCPHQHYGNPGNTWSPADGEAL